MVNRLVYLCIKNVYNMGKSVGIFGVILGTVSSLSNQPIRNTVRIYSLIHYFINIFSQVLSTNKTSYLPVLNPSYTHNPQDLLLSIRI